MAQQNLKAYNFIVVSRGEQLACTKVDAEYRRGDGWTVRIDRPITINDPAITPLLALMIQPVENEWLDVAITANGQVVRRMHLHRVEAAHYEIRLANDEGRDLIESLTLRPQDVNVEILTGTP